MNNEFWNLSMQEGINAYNNIGGDVMMFQQNPSNKVTFNPEMHAQNVERRIMERGNFFNNDTQHLRYKAKEMDYGKYMNTGNVGEITGRMMDPSSLDQGMPMRPESASSYMDQYMEPENPQIDFNLYKHQSNINVSYHDPTQVSSQHQLTYSDLNADYQLLPPMKTITPDVRCSGIINKFGVDFIRFFGETTFVFSPFSILLSIISMYRGSKGTTEMELKSYFGFPDKNIIIEGIYNLINRVFGYSNMVYHSFMLFPKALELNQSYMTYINRIASFETYALRNIEYDVERINNIISQKTKKMVTNIINTKIINRMSSVLLLSVLCSHPMWKYRFKTKKTYSKPFYGNKHKNVQYMTRRDTACKYFEDNINQVLELETDADYVVGFVLPKNMSNPQLSYEQYEYYINNTKICNIKKIELPRQCYLSKIKVDNILRQSSMESVFKNAHLEDVTPSSNIVYLSDIIHQSVVIMDETGLSDHCDLINNAETASFIANHPFIFYFRMLRTNTLLFLGKSH